MNENIIPVLIGADLNCYNIARAFHERYGVKSYAFGRYILSAIKFSKIIKFTANPNIDDEKVMIEVLLDFAAAHKGRKLILFGCTDYYATAIARCRDQLTDYIIPYPDATLQPMMLGKSEFYNLCDKYGIPYPATVILHEAVDEGALSEEALGFPYPIIIKPSSSIEYWKYTFDGMKKIYSAKNPAEAVQIINRIYKHGYSEPMILQEMITGGDSYMRVLTTFSDQRGKVRAVCLGHTLLEEHTPKGLGNHSAIITESASEFPLTDKIIKMLEDLGYTGYANFDIKLNAGSTDDYRVFEINMRQGRSNYYLTAAGLNVAALATEIYDDEGEDVHICDREIFWHHVPKSIVYKYTEDSELIRKARTLAKSKSSRSSLWYRYDFQLNPLRFLCVIEHLRRQHKKYKTYYPKKS